MDLASILNNEHPAAKRRADLERDILSKLTSGSQFLSQLVTIIETPDKRFLVTEFYPGGSLAFHLRRAKRAYRNQQAPTKVIGETRVKYYAAEIVLAVAYLHSKGILHRDLKPSNVLIDRTGHVRLIDFGTCKDIRKDLDTRHDSDARTSRTKLGTTDYMAPEMLRGQPYGKAVDWWSFGVMLYELLYGILPIHEERDEDVIRRVIEQSEVDVPSDPNVSGVAQSFVSELLQKNPNARIGSNANGSRLLLRQAWFHDLLGQSKDPAMRMLSSRPPWLPTIDHTHDIKYMNPKLTNEELTPFPGVKLPYPFDPARHSPPSKPPAATAENGSGGGGGGFRYSFRNLGSIASPWSSQETGTRSNSSMNGHLGSEKDPNDPIPRRPLRRRGSPDPMENPYDNAPEMIEEPRNKKQGPEDFLTFFLCCGDGHCG